MTTIICLSLLQYLLKSHSINLLQTFYIKLFFLLSITILSIFTLDYLLKYLACFYFYKNNNFNISKKLPNIIYNYFNSLKRLIEIDASFKNLYLYSFLIYLILVLYFIGAYYIII